MVTCSHTHTYTHTHAHTHTLAAGEEGSQPGSGTEEGDSFFTAPQSGLLAKCDSANSTMFSVSLAGRASQGLMHTQYTHAHTQYTIHTHAHTNYTLRRAHILTLLHPAGTIMDLNIGAALWLAVRAKGTLRLPTGNNKQSKGLMAQSCKIE